MQWLRKFYRRENFYVPIPYNDQNKLPNYLINYKNDIYLVFIHFIKPTIIFIRMCR